jgi:alpha-L-fucosidase
VRALQPGLIINNRLDMGSREDYDAQAILPNADYKTPEQRIGVFDDQHPWETCMTLGTQWSWKPDDTIKSASECIRILVRCVSGDGNLLLNVGPMPSGEIEPRQVQVLAEIGAWLKKFGESVYGTRGGPYRNGEWGGSTRKGNVIYLHILQWDNGRLTLPPLDARISRSYAITGEKVTVDQSANGITLTNRQGKQGSPDTIVKLELDRSIDRMDPIDVQK